MNIEVADDPEGAARIAATLISQRCSEAHIGSGQVSVAFSGGSSPAAMLARLASDDAMPWSGIQAFQVDERAAPDGHDDRNHTQLTNILGERLMEATLHPMAVGHAGHPDPEVELARLAEAANRYSAVLREVAGNPPVLDVVHLGMGSDGHTASLIPGDDLAADGSIDVGISAPYQGRRRLTLTEPVLRAARHQVWLIPGAAKAPMVKRLVDGDANIPAGRVVTDSAVLVLDRAAAAALG